MFIGHFGIGLGLKRLAPHVSFPLLIAATVWADILWTAFLLMGWEHARISVGDTRWTPLALYDYPWSHSLLFLVLWGTALALVYRSYRPDVWGAIAVWIGVVSHWVLDWLTHRPDMPLYPSGPRYGVGLWNSISGTLIVELPLFVIGVWLYARSTRARDRIGRFGFWSYISATGSVGHPQLWRRWPQLVWSLRLFFLRGHGGSIDIANGSQHWSQSLHAERDTGLCYYSR